MKESSEEIAKIAARVLNNKSFSKDARRLAASCLAQREQEPKLVLERHFGGVFTTSEIEIGKPLEISGKEDKLIVNWEKK